MKPIFRIIIDQKDISAQIKTRLIDLSVTDEAGFQSDLLCLKLDNANQTLELPQKGRRLSVELGYAETGLVFVGDFVIDEVELAGPPEVLTVRARGADLREQLKSSKTRSFDQLLLGDLLRAIAADNELVAVVDADYDNRLINHIDQINESDLHFLARLGKDQGALVKFLGNHLLFKKKHQGQSVSGKHLPKINISRKDVTQYRLPLSDRSSIGHVVAYWQDLGKGRRTGAVAGDKNRPGKKLHQTFPTAEQAQAAAQAELESMQRGQRELHLTLRGNPLLQAETPIYLDESWHSALMGDYIVSRVEHNFSSSGYISSVQAH